MVNPLAQISPRNKGINKVRTFSIAGFLAILITFPMILSSSEERQTTQQYAASSPTVSPTPDPEVLAVSTPFYIYSKNLPGETPTDGWTKFSFTGANANYGNTSPVYTPPYSLKFESSAMLDWFGLYRTAPIDISTYQYLSFYLQPQEPGLSYQVALLKPPTTPGDGPQIAGTWQSLPGFSNTGQWTVFNIPLTTFGSGTTPVHGIAFRDSSGGRALPSLSVYIDEIAFTAEPQPGAQPGGGGGNTGVVTPTPSPGPEERIYSPIINPLIFIIPALIIFAAMFF